MSVTFKSDDWKYAEHRINELLQNQRDVLENPSKTYKEKLLANGQILALKTLLKLPQATELAAKGNNQS